MAHLHGRLQLLDRGGRLLTVASLRGRPLRVLSELAGLLGAEITGTIAVALAGVPLALMFPTAWVPWIAMPVVLAGAGPVGYDMAQSWVPEDERLPAAAAGFRLAVHAVGVAGSLVLAGAVMVVANAALTWPTGMMAMLAFLGLPYLAAVGRNVAVRRLPRAKAVLPIAVTGIVVAALALLFAGALLLGRLFGGD
jgi:hypothetical protein